MFETKKVKKLKKEKQKLEQELIDARERIKNRDNYITALTDELKEVKQNREEQKKQKELFESRTVLAETKLGKIRNAIMNNPDNEYQAFWEIYKIMFGRKTWKGVIMKNEYNNLTLYNISNKFLELMDKIKDGEVTEEEYNAIGEQLASELQNKSINIVGYIENESSLIEAIDVQIKRLQDLKKSKQDNLEKFKKYVKDNMEKLNLQKIETEIGILSVAKSPMSVEIIDEEKIPGEYKKIVQEVKVNKTKIKENFKETGEIIEGVKILTDNTYLKIK